MDRGASTPKAEEATTEPPPRRRREIALLAGAGVASGLLGALAAWAVGPAWLWALVPLPLAGAALAAWRQEARQRERDGAALAVALNELRLLRESIEVTPTPFALYDANNLLVAWNRSYEEVHAVDFATLERPIHYELLIRASLPALLPPEEVDRRIAERLQLHHEANGTPLDRLYPTGRWMRITKQRTRSGGIAGFASDVTELHEAKEAAELADRSKSEFLATMSHELRTPLNAVIGFAEILEHEVLGPLGNPRYRGYASDIHRSGTHLLALINQILDLAKAEAGKMELQEHSFDLEPLLHDTLRMMEPRSQQAGVEVTLELPDQPVRLQADRLKLLQVTVNLLSNAVKFTPPGGEVCLRVALDERGLSLVFEDNGIGIAPEDLDKVLQPFGQAASALTRAREGTGLGLPLAKRLAELHGGALDIDSAPGRGTRVTVRLPAARLLGPAA